MSEGDREQLVAHLRYLQELGIVYVDFGESGESPDLDKAKALEGLWRDYVDGCARCPLAEAGRNNIVFGDGSPSAQLMFIGEGPGRDEDLQGLPFVGRAGQKLNEIITAMGLRRQDVYIANIVKCRPPDNRAPKPEEIRACLPYLENQVAIIQPKVICALGGVSALTLLNTTEPISRLRGRFHNYRGIPLMPTYHPAYLLRNYTPQTRKEVWEDARKIIGLLGAK